MKIRLILILNLYMKINFIYCGNFHHKN